MNPIDPTTIRLLDVNFNRLTEALRVVEDQLRFQPTPSEATESIRNARRRVDGWRQHIESKLRSPLATFRDVASDPAAPVNREPTDHSPTTGGGSSVYEHAEQNEPNVLGRNLARAREAARSIEEALRSPDRELARDVESLRYSLYELEPELRGREYWRARIAEVRLYVLLTTDLAAGPLDEVCRAAIEGGAAMIQLREKTMESGAFSRLASEISPICRELGAIFVVNDRPDIARICGADGVHQGQTDLAPSVARTILGSHGIVGVSTHGEAQARAADVAGADYIGVGPIFPTNTKVHRDAVGLDYIGAAARVCRAPGFAIGSVNRSTIGDVLAAGAKRVAVCTDVIADPDPRGAARRLRDQLDAAWS